MPPPPPPGPPPLPGPRPPLGRIPGGGPRKPGPASAGFGLRQIARNVETPFETLRIFLREIHRALIYPQQLAICIAGHAIGEGGFDLWSQQRKGSRGIAAAVAEILKLHPQILDEFGLPIEPENPVQPFFRAQKWIAAAQHFDEAAFAALEIECGNIGG